MHDPSMWDHIAILMVAAEEEESMEPKVEQMLQHNISLCRRDYIVAILNRHPKNCYNMFQMEIYAFHVSCNTLHANAIMESIRGAFVKEAVTDN